MKLKTLFLIGISVLVLVFFASCGGDKADESPFSTPEPPATQPEGDAGGGAAAGGTEVSIDLPPGVVVDPVDFTTEGTFAYFTDPLYGLIIINVMDPSIPMIAAWDEIADNPPTELIVSGGYAYVGIDDGGIAIIDVDPMMEASVVSSFSDAGSVGEFIIVNGFIYTADPQNGLMIIDISDPLVPELLNTVEGSFHDVDFADGFAYLASGADGLTIIDVDPPEDAAIVSTVPTVANGSAVDVKVLGGYAYLATGNNGPDTVDEPSGLEIINVTPPEEAAVVHSVETTGNFAKKVILFEGFAYAWAGDNTIEVVDISAPAEASVFQSWPEWGGDKRIATTGPLMFVLEYADGVKITGMMSE